MEENIWLKDLTDGLDAPELERVTEEIHRRGKAARIKAYLDIITRANTMSFEEAYTMRKQAKTFEQVLRDIGWIAKWEAEGEAKGTAIGRQEGERKVHQIIDLLRSGKSPEEILREYDERLAVSS